MSLSIIVPVSGGLESTYLPQEARSLINIVNDQPFIDFRENFIYEARLSSLQMDFKYRVWALYEAAYKFDWPKDPIVKEPAGDVIVDEDKRDKEHEY